MIKNIIKALSLAILLSMPLSMGTIKGFAASDTTSVQVPPIPERPLTSASQPDAYEVIMPPTYDDNNWCGMPYNAWMAGSNPLYLLSDLVYLTSSNTPNTSYSLGQPTTVNHPYSDPGKPFVFGTTGMSYEYFNGIGMHPKSPTGKVFERQDSWTIYDISAFTTENSTTSADTFYALVGLTSSANDWGNKYQSAGVYVYIYGDKTGDGQHYELLAESELIQGDYLGEFNVNIRGVKLLLIDVILPETATSHAYSAVGFGGACLFTADPSAQKPDYTDQVNQHRHSYSDPQQHSAAQHKTVCWSCENTIYEKHTWDDGVITTPPTCMQKGVRTYTCTGCNYWKVEIVKETHVWTERTAENDTQHETKCSCCGLIESFDHVYDDEEDSVCNDCGYQRSLSDPFASETDTSPKPETEVPTQLKTDTSPSPKTETTSSPETKRTSKKPLPGCESTLTVGAGLTLLLSIGSAGLIFKGKED